MHTARPPVMVAAVAFPRAILRTFRGIVAALRARPWVALGVGAGVAAFNLLVPVLLLSLLRKPADFFTFNPWLRRLTVYLTSPVPLGEKLSFLQHLSIAWVSADGPND